MRRDPVVRENGVWFFRFCRILKHMHLHAGGAEFLHCCVEFLSRDCAERFNGAIKSTLKRVVGRRLWVRIKTAGAYHQHRICTFREHSSPRHRSSRLLLYPKEKSTSPPGCTPFPFYGTHLE